MTPIFYYLLKVILCSGLLFGYYHLALKNKAFHQWNRFYLLSAVALSLLLPALQITLFPGYEQDSKAIQLIRVVQSADDYLEEFTISSHNAFSPETWITVGYAGVSFLLLTLLIYSLVKIASLARKHPAQWLANIRFINTKEPGTPFSFFRTIFWNEAIPLQSETGQQIFQHELVHVKEGHTLDKLFMQVVLMLFWCNPVFWLVRRELKFIHEFIADKKAVGQHGKAAFAAMIMQTVYPQHYHAIVNPFFQTAIKRRLFMLTKIQNPRKAYISRIIALPLIAVIDFAFTVRTTTIDPLNVALHKEIVVIIDAGHGEKNGTSTGAQFENFSEDAIVLQIAKKVQALNSNTNLRIVLTRTDRNNMSLQDRVLLAKKENADVFISLHTNASEKSESGPDGFRVYVPVENYAFDKQSQALGSAVVAELSKDYKTDPQLIKNQTRVYVLNQSPCAAVLIECGSITTKADRNFISAEKNQELIARDLLNAIQQYAASIQNKTTGSLIKVKHEIASVDVNTNKKEIAITYNDGTAETLTEAEAQKRGLLNNDYTNTKSSTRNSVAIQGVTIMRETASKRILADTTPVPLYIIDGKEASADAVSKIDPSNIASINVLKGDIATIKYGNKGKNGVVEITMKPTIVENKTDKTTVIQTSNYNGKAYYVVKINGVIKSIDVNGKPVSQSEFPSYQTTISEIQRINEDHLRAVTKDAQLNLEKQQEQALSNYRNEKGIVDDGPIFTETEAEASIDPQEWRIFLLKYTQPILDEISKKAPAGTYTAYVRFLVNKDGKTSDYQIVKDPGYGIGDKLLAIMPNAPRWTPAMQNHKVVKSYHTQPITFNVGN